MSLALTGAGHGALAFAAGMLTQALAQPRGSGEGFGLLKICYVGLGAACVKGAGSTLLGYFQARTAGEVALVARRRFVTRWGKDGLPDKGPRVLATVAVRLAELEAAVAQGAMSGARALAQLLPIVVGLILVSPLLAFVGTLVLIPFAVLLAKLRSRFRRASELAQARAVQLHEGVDELVSHIDLWRTFGATGRVAQVLEETGSHAVRAVARVEASRAALSGANEALGALALVGCVALAERVGMSFGDGRLVAFAAVCFMAYRPLRDLGDARSWMERGASARSALETNVVEPREVDTSAESRTSWHAHAGRLELWEFGATERGPRTSVSLAPSETLAVLGPSGVGKTTLLRGLLGLERTVGKLRYGDLDLTDAAVGPDARPFAWVPQDAPLVTGSLLENVSLACGDELRARRALTELGAVDLLARADERVGPGGTPLSGGERRLVALARAIATELPVLLLDEPTEGLDAVSRAHVLGAVAKLAGTRCIILVTHHAEVAALATRVITLDACVPQALAAE
ncbi:MAG: ABC transporter ATP-binding protein [Myxococcales bacterium]|nr:ABC transporter ATP-binding protein [Myxococcales bacterium]